MFQDISISLSPIGPWPVLVGAALAVLALTLWAYSRRLRGTSGRWRWFALSLRLLALLLCLMAALRPSVFLKEKKRQAASLVFLIDSSTSMLMADEVRGKTRWQVGKEALDQAREFAKGLGPDLEVKFYRFDATVSEPKEGDLTAEPKGRETDLGSAMLDVQKRQQGISKRIARMDHLPPPKRLVGLRELQIVHLAVAPFEGCGPRLANGVGVQRAAGSDGHRRLAGRKIDHGHGAVDD